MISTEATKLVKPSYSLPNNDSENKSGKGKHDKGGKGAKSQKDKSKPGGNGSKVKCGYCGGAHWQANCFKIITNPITGPANQPMGPQTPNSTLRIATAIWSAGDDLQRMDWAGGSKQNLLQAAFQWQLVFSGSLKCCTEEEERQGWTNKFKSLN